MLWETYMTYNPTNLESSPRDHSKQGHRTMPCTRTGIPLRFIPAGDDRR